MDPILTVGSVAFDSIKTPSGEASRVVGGAATYFSVAASYFTDVRLVAVVGEDFTDEQMRVFAGRSIDLGGLQRLPGETFRWKGEYSSNFSQRKTIYTHLNVFDQFRPVLPENYRQTPFVFLANIHPDIQLSVMAQMNKKSVEKVNNFLQKAEDHFKQKQHVFDKDWKEFDKIMNKKNISRKECLLLPLKATLNALNS